MDVLREACSTTLEEWEDGFRRDLFPEKNIEFWLRVADAYEEVTNRFTLTLVQKKTLLGLLNSGSLAAYAYASRVTEYEVLPAEVAHEAIRAYNRSSGETDAGDE